VHMIALCLIRLAMLDASRAANTHVALLSFSRALTETRLFIRLLLIKACVLPYAAIWDDFVRRCSLHRVNSKPNRQFSRDRQEYRKNSRGLQQKRKGRKFVNKYLKPQLPDPEILKSNNGLFLLS